MPDRGEVWLADLDPRRGTEPGKTRPVLIVQSQALLDAGHPSTLVVPLTTALVEDAEPLRVRVPAVLAVSRFTDFLFGEYKGKASKRPSPGEGDVGSQQPRFSGADGRSRMGRHGS